MVTESQWQINEGDIIGFRGHHGNSCPMEDWKGKNLIFIGGGIAMPPIRCAIWQTLENRVKYGDITIVYGACTAADFVFANELDQWTQAERTRVVRCVDPGGETPDWKYEVGLTPHVIERAAVPAQNSIALVVGPPNLIKFTLPVLDKMGLGPKDIYTILENRMKCGVGKCGRCNSNQIIRLLHPVSPIASSVLPYVAAIHLSMPSHN